jgi:UDP-2,4-diacetamido-2,4,6-trideoxy-beta-L-altropyranose hydrolase
VKAIAAQEIVFRTDAALQIGTGHVMRCLTLAEALAERGAHCRFVCREHSGNLMELIRDRGFDAIGLPVASGRLATDASSDEPVGAHATWLGSDCAVDAEQVCAVLGDTDADWLIVDHYALDVRWERTLRSRCRRLMVIDDLADRIHDCDLLLDQNLGREPRDYAGLVPNCSAILVGPRYALLRPEFAALRDYSLHRRVIPKLKRILITMGGVDQTDVTSRVLEALKTCSLSRDIEITVVMGRHAPWLSNVRLQAAQMPWAVGVLVDVRDMAQIMADSDLAIGAAGTTSWERCSLGLPALVVALADNQRESAAALEHTGAAFQVSGLESLESGLKAGLAALDESNRLSDMIRACARVTDGAGTSRVMSMMFEQHET